MSTEMAEWYRAGYFTTSLLVRRQCDERYFSLGELVTLCGGGNPFQLGVRVPPLKNEVQKLPEHDLLQLQFMQAFAMRQARAFGQNEAWPGMPPMPQRDLFAQQMMTQPQVPVRAFYTI